MKSHAHTHLKIDFSVNVCFLIERCNPDGVSILGIQTVKACCYVPSKTLHHSVSVQWEKEPKPSRSLGMVCMPTRHLHAVIIQLLLQRILCFPCFFVQTCRKIDPKKEPGISEAYSVSYFTAEGHRYILTLLGSTEYQHRRRLLQQSSGVLWEQVGSPQGTEYGSLRLQVLLQLLHLWKATSSGIDYHLVKYVSMTYEFHLRQRTNSFCQIGVLRYQTSKSQTSGGKILKSWSASIALRLNIKQTFENPYKTWTRLFLMPLKSIESAEVKPGWELSTW